MNLMNLMNSHEILQSLIASGKLTDMDVAIMEDAMKKDQIAKKHPYKIYKSDGRYCTYVKGEACNRNKPRRITALTEDRLYEKLYDHYFNKITFDTLLEDWIEYSETQTSRKPKTIREDTFTYNRYLKGTSISKKDIRDLETRDFIKFFDNLLIEDPTKKQIDKVKVLIKQLYGQAVMNGIAVVNPVLQMDTYFKTKDYRQTDETPGYSEEERNKMLSYMQSIKDANIYDYAIIFMFCLTIRIGELKALKWSCIKDNTIYVYRQIDSDGKECDVKKKSQKGHRYLPISKLAWSVLKKIPNDGDYIFMKDDKTLLTDSFNVRLEKRCKECGVRYLSSHKIRFSNCTMLLDKGIDIRDVQTAMGHTDQRMTEHYNRPIGPKAVNYSIAEVLTQGATNGLQAET